MRRPRRGLPAAALIATAVMLAAPAGASAHVRKTFGSTVLVYGWAEEPAFSGSQNAVDVDVSTLAGAPRTDAGGDLTVGVSFGGRRIVLPLLSTPKPGEFSAPIVPTRPGTYSFHISGTVGGTPIDTTSTCSDTTFNCVTDSSEIEFPAGDPSSGRVAERLARELPRVDRARDTASTARDLALGALVVALLALAAAIYFGLRRRTSA